MSYVLGVGVGQGLVSTFVCTCASADRAHAEEFSVREPAAAAFDGTTLLVGQAAVDHVRAHPASALSDYLTRVGDDVPLAVGDARMAAHDVYARGALGGRPRHR